VKNGDGYFDSNVAEGIENDGNFRVAYGTLFAPFVEGIGGGVTGRTWVDDDANLVTRWMVQDSLTVGAGGFVTLDGNSDGSPTTSRLNTLTIASHASADPNIGVIWDGTVDIKGNCLVIHDGNHSDIWDQVKSGYNGGLWNGPGITSSTAAAEALTTGYTAVAVATADQILGGSGPWQGVSVEPNDILVMFTFYGDATMDGVVNFDNDFTAWQHGWTYGLSGWANGDFDYSGVVDFDNDFTAWQYGYIYTNQNKGEFDYVGEEGIEDLMDFLSVCIACKNTDSPFTLDEATEVADFLGFTNYADFLDFLNFLAGYGPAYSEQ